MAPRRRNGIQAVNVCLCASATLFLVLAAGPSVARADPLGAGSGTIYRLGPASTYQYGCFPPCLCPIWLADGVRGTFKLTFTGTDATSNIHSYAVDDVNWTVPVEDPNLRIVGSGTYLIGSPDPITVVQHRMQLDLRVGDGVVEHFDSGWVPVDQFEGIHITVSMNGMVCFDTVLEIAAEPVPPSEIQHYSLVEGSTFQRGCFNPCDCLLEPQRPMVGTFDLVPLSDDGTWAEFAAVNVDLMVLSGSPDDVISIAGFGIYQRFAEFVVQHRLSLELIVDDENRVHFDSGLVVSVVPFPRIDIVVTVNGMVCFDTVLHVVADPPGETVCGGFVGDTCEEGEFCKFATGVCNDWVDDTGVCTQIPDSCPEIYDPVCGCDDVTYDNECAANAASMSILHYGPCVPIGACCVDIDDGPVSFDTCISTDQDACQAGGGIFQGVDSACGDMQACCFSGVDSEYCSDMNPFCCVISGGIAQGVGSTCTDLPGSGGCGQPCGGFGGIPCDDPGQFCMLPPGGCCCDFMGVCATPPEACPLGLDPVCGCDGVTYAKACEAAMASVSIDHFGPCDGNCPNVWDPVCGIDGVTYSNACFAELAGVSIAYPGECGVGACCVDIGGSPLPVPVCGETTADVCAGPSGFFAGTGTSCEPVEACCLVNQGDGACVEILPFCCEAFDGMPRGPGTTCETACPQVCGGIAGIQCDDPGSFCEFPRGTCNMSDIFGECTPIASGCPGVWDPVCGCDGTTYGNECEAEAAGVSIDHPGECTGGPCAATRVLSDPDLSYCTGVPKTVHILLTPPDSVTAVALNDTPPAGWIVSHVSHGGAFDAIYGKVKWGPFYAPDVPPEVSYDVTSPAGNVDMVCFEGTISLDGVNIPVCGDDCIAGEACCPFMDADLSQPHCTACPAADCAGTAGSCADGRISLTEIGGYACAWMTGCNDDLSGMTRAAFVWRNGECYCWDDADLNWLPTACPAPESGCCPPSGRGSDSTVGSATAVLAWDNLKKGVRSSSDGGESWTRELEIAMTVEPPPGTSATGVEMSIPRGWTVVTTIDGGHWDEIHRKVKWGPTFGDLAQSLTLRVRWLPGDAVPVAHRSARGGSANGFEGVVSFDGLNQPISMPWRFGEPHAAADSGHDRSNRKGGRR